MLLNRKHVTLLLLLFTLITQTYAQKITLVKDSLMNAYMESGFATKNFRPEGPDNAEGRRHGQWKDYEVVTFGSYQLGKEEPVQVMGKYLLYGEGTFTNGKRTGPWRIYVIEDKTFRKILSQTLQFQEGVAEGPYTYYYPDGSTAQTGVYQAGKIEGPVTTLYPDGALFGKQIFVAGQKNGRQEYFFPERKLKYFFTYSNGRKEGPYESYYPDGKVQESFNYAADSLDGTYHYYYPNGQLWTEKEYRNGLMWNITGTYDDTGKPRNKGTLKNGNGYINYYTEDGKIYSVVTFKEGVKIKEEERDIR